MIELVKLGVFLVFGAILTTDLLFADGWAAVAIAAFTLLLARPIAVFAALAGSRQVDNAAKAFMAWFGPKGVATMTFALLVLASDAPNAERVAGHRRPDGVCVDRRAWSDRPPGGGVDGASRRAQAGGGGRRLRPGHLGGLPGPRLPESRRMDPTRKRKIRLVVTLGLAVCLAVDAPVHELQRLHGGQQAQRAEAGPLLRGHRQGGGLIGQPRRRSPSLPDP